ncbi:hypothetical protein [Empedobacter brevis]|uniref:hypothetical protein n=1 Tax=Empedobacter brevis TaxID=247 RepID=UPI0039AEFB1F
MNENNPIESLNEIKTMMQRTSKFTSISGWSGAWVGVVGMISASIAYVLISKNALQVEYNETSMPILMKDLEIKLFILGILTLITACIGGFFFINKKSAKDGFKFINPLTKRILSKFFFVLIIGGLLSLIFINNFSFAYVAPATLMFYGLALYTVERDTIAEIKYLAICEIVLGLLAFYFIFNGLLFWFVGFGLLHFIFGIWMVRKYDYKA